MPPPEHLLKDTDFAPMTRSALSAGLHRLRVRQGGAVMAHVRLSAFRWVVGGIDTVVDALREAVGPDGTLLAYTGWEDSPYHAPMWRDGNPGWAEAYEREMPPFDPEVSSARREFGRFPERLRTWPGALRSDHPEASFAALGPLADRLVMDQRDDDPFGPEGPLGRLCEADGQVVLVGAPLRSLTLCHHAEALADLPGRRFRTYRMPVAGEGLREYRTIDTFSGAFPYWGPGAPELVDASPVATMAGAALAAGAETARGRVGAADVRVFGARAVVAAARGWLERSFG